MILLPTIEELTKLTDKQRLFVEEYCKCWNATQAAERAGITAVNYGQIKKQYMEHSIIRKAIDRRLDYLSYKCQIDRESIVAELKKIAFGDIRQVINWSRDNLSLNDPGSITDDDAAMISEISRTRDGWKVKLHDKGAALERLARMLGYDRHIVEFKGLGGEAYKEAAATLDPKEAAAAYAAVRDGA